MALDIVFMGTPDFAVPCLEQLIADGHRVKGVFTQPDKPVGRHQTLTPPPVKRLAEQRGIPVWQPAKLRDGSALEILRGLAPDLIVVVAGTSWTAPGWGASTSTAASCPNTGGRRRFSGR